MARQWAFPKHCLFFLNERAPESIEFLPNHLKKEYRSLFVHVSRNQSIYCNSHKELLLSWNPNFYDVLHSRTPLPPTVHLPLIEQPVLEALFLCSIRSKSSYPSLTPLLLHMCTRPPDQRMNSGLEWTGSLIHNTINNRCASCTRRWKLLFLCHFLHAYRKCMAESNSTVFCPSRCHMFWLHIISPFQMWKQTVLSLNLNK